MRKVSVVAVIAALALGLSACGGSDSGTTSGGTTTTTTVATQAAGFKAVQSVQNLWGQMQSLPAAQTIKTTDAGSCDTCSFSTNEWSCTICGTSGSCTGTWSASEAGPTVNMELVCDNYQEADGSLLDGSMTVEMSINQSFGAMTIKSAAKSTDGDGSDSCLYSADETTLPSCSESSTSSQWCCTTSDTCGASSSDFFFSIIMTIGSEGFRIVDPTCGNIDVTIAAGSTLSTYVCASDPSAQPFVMNFSWTGTGDFSSVAGTSDANVQCTL